MKITLEEIKTQQNKVAEMIAVFEANQKLSTEFPLTINFPTLNAGEQYVGCIISQNGSKHKHVILLPEEHKRTTWQSAMDWALSIGGSLPDYREHACFSSTHKTVLIPTNGIGHLRSSPTTPATPGCKISATAARATTTSRTSTELVQYAESICKKKKFLTQQEI